MVNASTPWFRKLLIVQNPGISARMGNFGSLHAMDRPAAEKPQRECCASSLASCSRLAVFNEHRQCDWLRPVIDNLIFEMGLHHGFTVAGRQNIDRNNAVTRYSCDVATMMPVKVL